MILGSSCAGILGEHACLCHLTALNSRGAVADAVSVSRDAQVAFVFVALLLSGGAKKQQG